MHALLQKPACIFNLLITTAIAFRPFLRNWQCVGILDKIDFRKPHVVNIGELPLVIWQTRKYPHSEYSSTINICRHMGSKLDNAKITEMGCLKCQYHGLEYSSDTMNQDNFGKVVAHDGKLFWAYKPEHAAPLSTPHYNDPDYKTTILEIDMPCSLQDSAYNTMDLRHPEYVHNNPLGFGNNIPPTNVQHSFDPNNPESVGLSFEYASTSLANRRFKTKTTYNYHMYHYPSFTWSRVSIPVKIDESKSKSQSQTDTQKNLIISANFLPLAPKKTRWTVTVCHNYFKAPHERKLVKAMAYSILFQDFQQMKNQSPENPLKRKIMFNKIFKDEDPILLLKDQFDQYYKYPDMEEVMKLYDDPTDYD